MTVRIGLIAEEIVGRAALLDSPSESLADQARTFRGALVRAAGGGR